MAVIDKMGHVAVGTSTNGATFKIPGSYIPLSEPLLTGGLVMVRLQDLQHMLMMKFGACGATGDGDIMMRFLPCYQIVENMRLGLEPKIAAEDAYTESQKNILTLLEQCSL
ncbi:putative isoaspartyl peptidase/L-asparaginase 3 [Drosera capensis]